MHWYFRILYTWWYVSTLKEITHGVPKGTILGPLLFIMFIHDITGSNSFFKYTLFADDSTVTCKFDSNDEISITQRLESELGSIHNWLMVNKIKINLEKCKFIIFSYRKKYLFENLKFGYSHITIADTTRFLDLVIDKNLNFREHAAGLCNKLSKVNGIIFRLNKILPPDSLKSIYAALFEPHLLYGIEVWHGSPRCNHDRVFILQKKCMRAMNSLPYNTHTSPYFKSMNILKLEDLFKLKIILNIYDSPNISTQQDIHSHNTRNSHNLIVQRYNTSRIQHTWLYRGLQLWNSVPSNIRELPYRGALKGAVRGELMSGY